VGRRLVAARALTTDNLGFLLAKASQRWNERLYEQFRDSGFAEVRPSYGSILLPLYEEDPLRMGELATRARLSKQTMTTLVRLMERQGLVERRRDRRDGRVWLIYLTPRARAFEPVAEKVVRELERSIEKRIGERKLALLRSALHDAAALVGDERG
jgi:DNA-binding MarR family transcriptional regulator